MSYSDYMSELNAAQDVYDYLQTKPLGLSPEQAWDVIHFIGNLFCRIPDTVEKCCVCGALYHRSTSGDCLDYPVPDLDPVDLYFFCDSCMSSTCYDLKYRLGEDDKKVFRYRWGCHLLVLFPETPYVDGYATLYTLKRHRWSRLSTELTLDDLLKDRWVQRVYDVDLRRFAKIQQAYGRWVKWTSSK